MTSTTSALPAERIVELRNELSALPVLLAGTLDDKIAELKAEQDKTAAQLDAANGNLAAIVQRENDVAAGETALKAQIADFASTQRVAADNAASLKASLDARLRVVSDGEATLAAGQAALESDRKAFNERLDALKVPA
jgi:chromosome segregation ATPase